MVGCDNLSDRVREVLAQLEAGEDLQPVLEQALEAISEASGFESVGIRWKAGEDYPYYVTRGFGKDFVVREGPLCERDAASTVIRHPDGTPQLACLCGAVVTGRTDPRWPFFTKGGSFWTNQARGLAPGLSSERLGFRVRAYCAEVGYEVVALIPLKAQDEILGLLQMNSRRLGALGKETIEAYEAVAREIAEAVAPRMGVTSVR